MKGQKRDTSKISSSTSNVTMVTTRSMTFPTLPPAQKKMHTRSTVITCSNFGANRCERFPMLISVTSVIYGTTETLWIWDWKEIQEDTSAQQCICHLIILSRNKSLPSEETPLSSEQKNQFVSPEPNFVTQSLLNESSLHSISILWSMTT